MTGITQSQPVPSRRPRNGIPSLTEEERIMAAYLEGTGIESGIANRWPHQTPTEIAAAINLARPGMKMTARWVESIKRRIDRRQQEAQKK